MAKMEKKTLSDPEEKRSFDKGQLEFYRFWCKLKRLGFRR